MFLEIGTIDHLFLRILNMCGVHKVTNEVTLLKFEVPKSHIFYQRICKNVIT